MILNKNKKNISLQISESVDNGSSSEIYINNDMFIVIHQKDTNNSTTFKKDISKEFIQFHFCLGGSGELSFNDGSYKLNLSNGKSLLLYNPQRILPINLTNLSKSKIVSLLISIKRFHFSSSET